MKLVFAFILLAALTALVAADQASSKRTKEEKKIFKEWRKKHNKHYKTKSEESAAMEKWFKNKKAIEEHNDLYEQGKVSYKRGVWEHSDLSREEKEKLLRGVKVPKEHQSDRTSRHAHKYPKFPEGPDSIDWNEKGLVGPVENQGKVLINISVPLINFIALISQVTVVLAGHFLLLVLLKLFSVKNMLTLMFHRSSN